MQTLLYQDNFEDAKGVSRSRYYVNEYGKWRHDLLSLERTEVGGM